MDSEIPESVTLAPSAVGTSSTTSNKDFIIQEPVTEAVPQGGVSLPIKMNQITQNRQVSNSGWFCGIILANFECAFFIFSHIIFSHNLSKMNYRMLVNRCLLKMSLTGYKRQIAHSDEIAPKLMCISNDLTNYHISKSQVVCSGQFSRRDYETNDL